MPEPDFVVTNIALPKLVLEPIRRAAYANGALATPDGPAATVARWGLTQFSKQLAEAEQASKQESAA